MHLFMHINSRDDTLTFTVNTPNEANSSGALLKQWLTALLKPSGRQSDRE